jgi:hypothetical protein
MKLIRSVLGTNGKPTLGMLISNDGKFKCPTLERPADDPEHKCIDAGTYHVTIDWHHPTDLEKRYRCPELTDVPGRSQIQIHIGNVIAHSLGCILVGETCGDDCVNDSGTAFRRLMKYLEGATLPFALEVINP